jgi:hypothetical protein
MTDKEAFIKYVNTIQGRKDLSINSIYQLAEKLEKYIADGKADKYAAKLAEAKQVINFLEDN